MIKSYAVVFQNQRNGRVGMDIYSDDFPELYGKTFSTATGIKII